MSKSKKNVVDPNDIISSYGADTARWFMLSDSPPERDLQWTDTGIAASFKFINRLYELVEKYKNHQSNNDEDSKDINELKIIINEVAKNIEAFQFNKSVAKIYEFVNILNDALLKNKLSKENFKWSLEKLSIILQPFSALDNIILSLLDKSKETFQLFKSIRKNKELDAKAKKILREIYVPGKIVNLVIK